MKKVYVLILALCAGITASAFTPQVATSFQLVDQISSTTRCLTTTPSTMTYSIGGKPSALAAADVIQPKDTIAIKATNLVIGEMVSIVGDVYGAAQASNEEYKVFFQFMKPVKAGSYVNIDFMSGNPIINLLQKDTIQMKKIVATVSFDDGHPIMIADVLGSDSNFYQMDLRFVLPKVVKTVNIDFTSVPTAKYFVEEGDYYIFNSNEDYAVQLDIFEDPNKLDGEYNVQDFYMHYTLVGEIENGDTTIYALADAKAVVTPVSDGVVKIKAELLSEEGVLYKVSTDVKLPKIGLQYDATEGKVERIYTSKDKVTVTTDYVEQYGLLYLDVVAADKKDILSLEFFVVNADKIIGIPEGKYPINNTTQMGSVSASPGLVEDMIYPSFYGKLNASGKLMTPCYFLRAGEVVVENVQGKLKVTVNALNSFDVPVHIVYDANATNVNNVEVKKNSRKLIKNNQLLIIKDGVQYNVLGNVVE